MRLSRCYLPPGISNYPPLHILYSIHPVRPQSPPSFVWGSFHFFLTSTAFSRSDRTVLLPLFFLLLGFFPPFFLRHKPFCPRSSQAMIQRLTAFIRGTRASGSALEQLSTFPRNFLFWPPTCAWYLRLLLHRDSLRHQSHSSHSRVPEQLSTWKHSPCLLHFFSADNRAVSSIALAHPHFFIASNKLFRSASDGSLSL